MNNKIIVKTDTGEELSYDIVGMVTNKVGSKNYVYFTKNEVDDEGNTIIYGSYFVVENNQVKLINEVSDEDYESIKEVYEILKENDDSSNSGNSSSNMINNQTTEVEIV